MIDGPSVITDGPAAGGQTVCERRPVFIFSSCLPHGVIANDYVMCCSFFRLAGSVAFVHVLLP